MSPNPGQTVPYRTRTSIVVVDDMPETVRSLTEIISRDKRFEVIATGQHGQEAIDLFEAYRPDIITMCIRMPVLDGISAARGIRAGHPDAKVIIITVGADANERTALREAGVARVLLKPVVSNELIAAILELTSAPPSEAASTAPA